MGSDPNFEQFINETESKPDSQRQTLENCLVSCFQRVTKYPLLLEQLLKATTAGTAEAQSYQAALESSRKILMEINEAVRREELKIRLLELKKSMDRTTSVAMYLLFKVHNRN